MPNHLLETQAKYEAALRDVEELTQLLLASAASTMDFAFEQNRLKKEALQLKIAILKLVLDAQAESVGVDDELDVLISQYVDQTNQFYLNPEDCSFFMQAQLKKMHDAAKEESFKRSISAVMNLCRNKILLQETNAEIIKQQIMRKINLRSSVDLSRLQAQAARLQVYADVQIIFTENTIRIKPFGDQRQPTQERNSAWYAEMLGVAAFMSLADKNTIVDSYATQVCTETPPAAPPQRQPSTARSLTQSVRYYMGW